MIPRPPPYDPREAVIDICSVCNVGCRYCLHQYAGLVKREIMSLENYERLINEVAAGTWKKIHLCRAGEPLLHPYFAEILEVTVDLGLKPIIATRVPRRFDLDKLVPILEHQPDVKWIVTIDALTQEVQDATSPKVDIEESWTRMVELKSIPGACVSGRTIIHGHNEHEAKAIRRRFLDAGVPWSCEVMSYFMGKHITCEDAEEIASYTVSSRHNKYTVKSKKVVPLIATAYRGQYCVQRAMRLSISPSGGVGVCCRDMMSEVSCGNVFETKLSEIVSSNAFRETVRRGALKQLPICKGCN